RHADGLLDRVHQREQPRRRQHPVAALLRALQQVRDSFAVAPRVGDRHVGVAAGHGVDVLAQPLPHSHQLQIVRMELARQRHDRTSGKYGSSSSVSASISGNFCTLPATSMSTSSIFPLSRSPISRYIAVLVSRWPLLSNIPIRSPTSTLVLGGTMKRSAAVMS